MFWYFLNWHRLIIIYYLLFRDFPSSLNVRIYIFIYLFKKIYIVEKKDQISATLKIILSLKLNIFWFLLQTYSVHPSAHPIKAKSTKPQIILLNSRKIRPNKKNDWNKILYLCWLFNNWIYYSIYHFFFIYSFTFTIFSNLNLFYTILIWLRLKIILFKF